MVVNINLKKNYYTKKLVTSIHPDPLFDNNNIKQKLV